MIVPVDATFEQLLEYVRRTRSFDFATYKRSTLTRRVAKRIAEVGLDNHTDYIDYLEVHTEEFVHLFNTILINVTAFFRDEQPWVCLREEVVPRILKHNPTDTIRIWSAGCASGEEAYSLAMVFAEALGEAAFRKRVKIYATDVDEEAMAQARQGAYLARAMEQVPPELRERYFEVSGQRHVFRPELRRSIIFGRHDLTRDAPISRLDLLVCRNTLMYFNAEAQAAIIHRLHFALQPDGFLFLGRAETLMSHSTLLAPLNAPARIFVKIPAGRPAETDLRQFVEPGRRSDTGEQRAARLRDFAFQGALQPQILVDANGMVAAANDAAHASLCIDERDYGRPFQDVEISYRPVELRGPIDEACGERRPVHLGNVERTRPGGEPQRLEVRVVPLIDHSRVLGVAITFIDITRERSLQEELKRTTEELETAYEELQSTNEELETTNEELQSTVEELETTNEELQSTNEELETANEELRSTNEELETMNEELRITTDEVDQGNICLSSVVNGLTVGVSVLDREHRVRTWNRVAEELWGLRADEVGGQPFFELDIGLPVAELKGMVQQCLTDQTSGEMVVHAVNRRGRALPCRITCSPFPDWSGGGALLVMQEVGLSAMPQPVSD